MLAASLQPHPVDAMILPPVLVRPTSGRVVVLPCRMFVPQNSLVAAVLMCQAVPSLHLDHGGHQAVHLSSVLVHRPHAPVSTCPDQSAHQPGRSSLLNAHEGSSCSQAAALA